jgi:signal peptidase II
MNRIPVRVLAYGVAALVFALDRITKILVSHNVPSWDVHALIPGFFNIVHTENSGAAFSMLANAPAQWRTLLLVALSAGVQAAIAVLIWRGGSRLSTALRLGLALILGGALGNLFDRVVHGTVTDFLEFYYHAFRWPAFNAADSAITIGAGLIILDMLRSRHAPRTV